MARLTISYIVRRFCLDCQGNSSQAVRECADEGCALWEHRLPPQGAAPHPLLAPDTAVLDHSAPPANGAPASPNNAGLGDASGARLEASSNGSRGDKFGNAGAAHAATGVSGGMGATGAQGVTTSTDASDVMGVSDARGVMPSTNASGVTAATGIGGRPDAKAREAARRIILRAVRRHCMTCAACRADVRTCAARECGLWSYRFGVNPETYRAVRQRFSRPKTLSLF